MTKLGKEILKNKTVLAPMAGYTDSAFRSICCNYGVGLTVTEMISSKAITMGNSTTFSLLHKYQNDTNCAVQIFGHEPEVMAESVKILEKHNFSAIDINMGCPVKKIVGNGDGSALLENPKLAGEVITAVKLASKKPVSVKFRLGVEDSKSVVDFAKMCEDSGADFVTVHFRTRKQLYSGEADFTTLPQIVSALNIPVVANGDVKSKADFDLLMQSGAFAVAIGRGALGKPYIFKEVLGEFYEFDLLETINRHANLLLEQKSERVASNEFKKHLAYYLKGIRHAKPTVVNIQTANSIAEQLQLVTEFLQNEIY